MFQSIGRRTTAVLVCVAALLLPVPLWAHALLMRSTPAVHATVHSSGFTIELTYNSRVDGKHSKLTLTTRADALAAHPLPLAALRQTAPNVLASSSPALAPGEYVLHWIALANDGHISRGEIPFTVK